jgi:hypothetical protein
MISWDRCTRSIILADSRRAYICAHCGTCSCIIRLTLGSRRYLTVNNSCSSHCYSLNLFFLCWFVACSTLCPISLRLIHFPHCLHPLLHQNIMVVVIVSLLTVIRAFQSLWLLLNDIQNTVFEGFFVLAQSVLFPCEIKDFIVKIVTD